MPRLDVTRTDASRRIQVLLLGSARVLSALVTLAVPIVLVRVFDPTTFGHYKQLFLLASTATILNLGLLGSLYYFVPRAPQASQAYVLQAALLLGLLGAVGGIMVAGGAPLFQRVFDAPPRSYLYWIALYVALSIPAPLAQIAPIVDRRARLAAVLVTVFDTARSALLVLVAVVFRSLTAVLITATGLMASQVAVAAAYVRWRGTRDRRRPDRTTLREQLGYSLPVAGTSLVALVREQLHSYYVATRFSAAGFATYAVGTFSMPLIDHVRQTLGDVTVIEHAAYFSDKRQSEMQQVWFRAVVALALLLVPLYSIFTVYAGDLIPLVFGQQYEPSVSIFRVYVLALPVYVLMLTAQVLRATGDLGTLMRAELAAIGVGLAVLLVAGPRFGLLGAAGSLVLGNAAFGLTTLPRTAVRLGLPIWRVLPLAKLGQAFCIGLACALGPWLALTSVTPVVRLAAGTLVAATLYVVVIWNVGLVSPLDRAFLKTRLERLLRAVKPGPPRASGVGAGGGDRQAQ